MPTRAVLLRLMLWSLALAAGAGVLAVLFSGGDLVWRVVGTGAVTAAACGLLIPTTGLIDGERTRAAGLLGMGAVIVEFFAALGLIWEVLPSLLWGVTDPELKSTLTMLLLGLATPIVMRTMTVRRGTSNRIAAVFLEWLTIVVLAIFLSATWHPRFASAVDSGIEKWWRTGATLLLFGALTTIALLQFCRDTPRVWRWLGILANVVACAMWLLDIWDPPGGPLAFVIFCAFLGVGCVVAHVNLCLIPRLPDRQAWVRTGAVLFMATTAALVVLVVAGQRLPTQVAIDTDLFIRFASATGIVGGCGSLALLVLARLHRKVDLEPSNTELDEIRLVCPRCRKNQTIRVGESSCAACGLRISVRVEEPRCANCDYLLHGLESDRCPECGATIAAKSALGT